MKNGRYRPIYSKGWLNCNECHGTGMVKVAGGTEKLKCLACRPKRKRR